MFIYRYDRVVVAGDVIYPQQGGWEGGPIELVRQFPECTYMRYPNKEAAEAVTAAPELNFREATEEEIASLGDLPTYPFRRNDN